MAIDGNYSLDSEAMDALVNYAWPGNIRELQNVIDHALILAASDRITLSDLPLQVTTASSDGGPGVNASAGDDSLREQAHLFEVGAIRRAIEQAGGDRRLAAERLGIGLSTLYRKLGEEE
jgi:two-component system response regulator AtoC